MQARDIKLALGPVLYYWEKEKLLDFYDEIMTSPVGIVYLGETICSRRRLMRAKDWLELAQRLQAAGKEVVLSTLALIEAGSELSSARRLCQQREFLVEANDMGAVQMRVGQGAFVAGHSVNIYNHRTLDLLAGLGMRRWVMPVELSRDTLKDILAQKTQAVETEVFAFGHLPLAYSARCYTARAHHLPKDDCKFRCLDYADGMLLKTREDEKFLILNGIQTQSSSVFNLVADLDNIKTMGIDVLRISPLSSVTPQVIRYFAEALQGSLDAEDAQQKINALIETEACDGYWYGNPGMATLEMSTGDQRNLP
jgi:collagenase-like PrtC family protease